MTKRSWWGKSASIDVYECDAKLIKSPEAIKRFVKGLAKVIDMKRVGDPYIKRFGHHELRGYSMMQFIETSSIVGHFDEDCQRAFIDIFSCKQFNSRIAAKYCKDFFKGKSIWMNVAERR